MKDHTSAASTRQAVEPDQPRFGSLELPSAPFWVVIIAGFIAISVRPGRRIGTVRVPIGVALSFFLVPVVNWLVRHGRAAHRCGDPRGRGPGHRDPGGPGHRDPDARRARQPRSSGRCPTLWRGPQGGRPVPASCRRGSRTRSRPWRPRSRRHRQLRQGRLVSSGSCRGCWAWSGSSFSFMLLPFFLFYLLKDQPKMAGNFYRKRARPWKADVSRMIDHLRHGLRAVLQGRVLVGSIMFVIVSVGMFAIGTVVAGRADPRDVRAPAGTRRVRVRAHPQIGPHHRLSAGAAARADGPTRRGGGRERLLLRRVQHRGLDPRAHVRGQDGQLQRRDRCWCSSRSASGSPASSGPSSRCPSRPSPATCSACSSVARRSRRGCLLQPRRTQMTPHGRCSPMRS